MIYVLDTNAVAALMKGSAALIERLAETESADLAIPQPVVAEIAFGIERLPRSKRRTTLQERFDLTPHWTCPLVIVSARIPPGTAPGVALVTITSGSGSIILGSVPIVEG